MSINLQPFFIVQSDPDGKGIPYFMDKHWTPELPDYEFYDSPPCEGDFLTAYSLKAKTYQLNGDYLVDENLVSNEMLYLCEKLNVKCIRIPVDINLHRGVRPQKKYFLFFPLSYLSILDKNESTYTISIDLDSGKLNTQEECGLKKTYYESIDKFKIKNNVREHLFFCNEIAASVCSIQFKNEYEALGLTGVSFKEINEHYQYSAWS
ncbi:imm11 family protein [Shewanella oncorhynchi]|uniref:imm11 family protein n=1 Tax=Shewanella oncorhynchi TaxID=2726434 RepID=UPI003D7B2A0C